MLIDKLSQAESNNNRLKDEVLSLKEEIKKRTKVEDGTSPLRATILDQQAKLFDKKIEFFHEIEKMTDKVKSIEKHLEMVSQTHQRMRDLQDKIIELEEWRSTEKKIPSSLPTIKGYDIIVYSIATKI
jgi:tRNA-dihydrouridine synthase